MCFFNLTELLERFIICIITLVKYGAFLNVLLSWPHFLAFLPEIKSHEDRKLKRIYLTNFLIALFLYLAISHYSFPCIWVHKELAYNQQFASNTSYYSWKWFVPHAEKFSGRFYELWKYQFFIAQLWVAGMFVKPHFDGINSGLPPQGPMIFSWIN